MLFMFVVSGSAQFQAALSVIYRVWTTSLIACPNRACAKPTLKAARFCLSVDTRAGAFE